MEYAEQYIALCLGGAGSASAPAPGIVLDGTAPFTLDMMVRGIPVESAASVLHQEGALDVRLTAKGFSFWREGFGILPTRTSPRWKPPATRSGRSCGETGRSETQYRHEQDEGRRLQRRPSFLYSIGYKTNHMIYSYQSND